MYHVISNKYMKAIIAFLSDSAAARSMPIYAKPSILKLLPWATQYIQYKQLIIYCLKPGGRLLTPLPSPGPLPAYYLPSTHLLEAVCGTAYLEGCPEPFIFVDRAAGACGRFLDCSSAAIAAVVEEEGEERGWERGEGATGRNVSCDEGRVGYMTVLKITRS
jgi:hypothetical protein